MKGLSGAAIRKQKSRANQKAQQFTQSLVSWLRARMQATRQTVKQAENCNKSKIEELFKKINERAAAVFEPGAWFGQELAEQRGGQE